MDVPDRELEVSVKALAKALFLVTAGLIALDLAALAFTMVTGHDHVMGLLPIIDLDKEHNLGTLFSVVLLTANAVLFLLAAAQEERGTSRRKAWGFLGLIFFFLAFDEYAYVHERLIIPMRELFDASAGILHFAWIIPYGVLVVLVGLLVGPVILRLPSHPRKWFVYSAIAYLSGALGCEAIGGWRLVSIGGESARPEFVYEFITTVEESLEMIGLVLLVYALVELIRLGAPNRVIRMAP